MHVCMAAACCHAFTAAGNMLLARAMHTYSLSYLVILGLAAWLVSSYQQGPSSHTC